MEPTATSTAQQTGESGLPEQENSKMRRHPLGRPNGPGTISGLLCLSIVAFWQASALGQTFNKIQPPVCRPDGSSVLQVPYLFHGTTLGTAHSLDVADNAYAPGTYLPNITTTRQVWANDWVNFFSVGLTRFDTELCCDFLTVGEKGFGTGTDDGISGQHSAFDLPNFNNGFLQTNPGLIKFTSDYSVQGTGVAAANLKVCGATSEVGIGNAAYFFPGQRQTGVLLGTGDTVFMRAASGGQHAQHVTYALWNDLEFDQTFPQQTDWDLYVRCGLPPTPTVYDWRGYTSTTNEFIHYIYDNCSADIWIAVNSFKGAGMFNLVSQEHYVAEHFTSAAANINYPAGAAELASWEQVFVDGYKQYWSASHGGVYIENLDIWNGNRNPNAFFTFHGECGRSHAVPNCTFGGFGGAGVEIFLTDNTAGCSSSSSSYRDRVLAHEMAHASGGLSDEYSGSCGNCAHTIMDTGFTGNNVNFCRSADHDTAHAPSCGSAPGGPGWSNSCLLGVVPFRPTETPDNFNFKYFDFHNIIANIRAH